MNTVSVMQNILSLGGLVLIGSQNIYIAIGVLMVAISIGIGVSRRTLL